ncbi:polyprotein [Mersevirus jujubae]|uniref:RNA1 polyprotein n=1 Tax=Comovirinae sp. TaxID=2767531 RepID=A0A861M2E1_9SECO|nr:polyprotein [Comovirinae sp.]
MAPFWFTNFSSLNDFLRLSETQQYHMLVQRVAERKRLLRRHEDLFFLACVFTTSVDVIDKWPGLVRPNELCVIGPAELEYDYNQLASGLSSYEDLVAYTRGLSIEHFNRDLVIDGQIGIERVSHPEDAVSFGQHFGSTLVSAFSKGKQAILTYAGSKWSTICDKLRSIFEKTLGCFFDVFAARCTWIKEYWAMVANKAQELYETTMPFMAGYRELMQIGMALIASVAMITFAERFLVAINILATPIGLTKLFIPAAIAIFGITGFMEFTSGGGTVKEALFGMVMNFLSVLPDWLVPSDGKKGGGGSTAQFAPSSVLQGFTSMINCFSNAGLNEMGKSAQALNSITSAVKNLKNGALAGVGYVASALESLLGTQAAELGDIGLVLGLGLQEWLEEIDALEEHFRIVQSSSKDLLMRATVLASKGSKLVAAIATKAVSPSTQVSNILIKANERVRKLQAALMLQGAGGSRIMPFVIAFVGKSRTGKTLLTTKMAQSICNHDGLPEANVYSRQPQDPYWSGYRRQHVVIQDDFAAVEQDVSDESSLMQLISSQECRLNMADLAEKGMFFDSGAFIYSSNFEDASPHSKVHDKEAFRNRRNVVVRVEIDTDREYKASDPTANQKYSVLKFVDGSPVVEAEFTSYDDLECHILNAYAVHVEEKRANLSSAVPVDPIKRGMHSMFDCFARDARNLGEALEIELEPGTRPFLLWLKQVWCVKDNELVCLPYESKICEESPGIMSLGRTLEALRSAPNINSVSLLYLERVMKELKELPGWNLSLEQWSLEPHIQDFVRSLSLEQRVVLILCHREFCRQNDEGTWVEKLVAVMKQGKDRIAAAIARWPMYAKAAMGVTLVVVLGGALWQILKVLASLCTGGGFTTAGGCLGYMHAIAQSKPPSRNTDSDYRFKNIPLRARHNRARGQNDCEFTSAQVAAKHLVCLKVGESETMAMILPGKRLMVVNHFARKIVCPMRAVIQRADGINLYCSLSPQRKELIEGSELATFHIPTLPEIRKSALRDIAWDSEMLATGEMQIRLYVFKYSEECGSHTYEYMDGIAHVVTKQLSIESGDYVRVIPKYLNYNIPTVNMDCGGLVLARIKGSWQIVGMHVAGTGNEGQACFIPGVPGSSVDETIPTSKGQCDLDTFMHFHEEVVASGPALVNVGKMKEKIFTPTKTKLVEVPKEWQIFGAETKEPSILSAEDPRIPENHRPFNVHEKGMRKYKQSCSDLDQHLLDGVVREIVEEFRDAGAEKFRSVDMHVALNGEVGCDYFDSIVTATSEGFPWVLERNGDKGKVRYLEGEPGNWNLPKDGPLERACTELEVAAREGRSKPLVGIECVKDELLPLRKIYADPKSRLFTVLPQEYNIVLRKFTLPFVAWMMKNRSQLCSQVGINPYSREWNRLAMSLQEKGSDILCCDYSSFDGLCTPQLMEAMTEIMGSFYERSEKMAIKTLLMSVFQRYSICGGRVYQVFGGIPSGIALTVILNSLMNEILVRYCWKRLMKPEGPMMMNAFKVHCAMVVYGDDNLISVGAAVKSAFNGKTLKGEMAKIGVTITDGIDKTSPVLEFRRLEQCDFLKRGFKLNSQGLWTAPQEKVSLFSQLVYVRESSYDSLAEAFRANGENVLREMWLHGPEAAKDFRDRFNNLGLSKLPSLAMVEAFHDEQMGSSVRALSVDLFSNTAFLGSLAATTTESSKMRLTPEVCASTLGLEDAGDFLVCIGIPVPKNREGIQINFRVGTGRGGLPTAENLRMVLCSKGAVIRKTILSQIRQNGRKVTFVSPNGNVVAMICALAWMRACGIVDKDFVSAGYQRAVEVCSRLGYDEQMQEILLSDPAPTFRPSGW